MKANPREQYMNRQIARLDELNPRWRDAMELFWIQNKDRLQHAYAAEKSGSIFERASNSIPQMENQLAYDIGTHFKNVAQQCFFNPRRILWRVNLVFMLDLYRLLWSTFMEAQAQSVDPMSLLPSLSQFEQLFPHRLPVDQQNSGAMPDRNTDAHPLPLQSKSDHHCPHSQDFAVSDLHQFAARYFELLQKIYTGDQNQHQSLRALYYREVPILECEVCSGTPFEYLQRPGDHQNALDDFDVLSVCRNFVMKKLEE